MNLIDKNDSILLYFLFFRQQKHIWKNKCVNVKHNSKKDLQQQEEELQEEKNHVLRLFVFFISFITTFRF